MSGSLHKKGNKKDLLNLVLLLSEAEIERDMISRRTKEALALRKAMGVHIGRIQGSKNSYNKLTGKEDEIRKLYLEGVSKTEIARRLNVDRTTIWRHKDIFENIKSRNKRGL